MFLKKITEIGELNMDSIQICFRNAYSGLESQEGQLNAILESMSKCSEELDLMRNSIKVWLRQVEEKEKDFGLICEEDIKDLELKKKELSLIEEHVKVVQEKLHQQEKLIEGLFEKKESEGKHFQTTQKAIAERFTGICSKEREVNLYKIQVRSIELDRREEILERRLKEIELREAVLASEKKELIPKENVVDAREKILDLRKVLISKDIELDSIKKPEGQYFEKLNSLSPPPSEGLGNKSRKRFVNSSMKFREISDANCNAPSKRICCAEGSSNNMGNQYFDKLNSLSPTPSEGPGNKSRKRFVNSSIKFREISDAYCNAPSKTICHAEGSSNSMGKGGTLGHSNPKSASGVPSGSNENLQPPCNSPVNGAAHSLTNDVSESDSHSGDHSVSNAIDHSQALILILNVCLLILSSLPD